VPDRRQLEDLWALLVDGGLAIDTCIGDQPALRTLLQLDGDRLTFVARAAVEPLPAEQRLRLAARHADAVRARSVGVLADGRSLGQVLRHVMLAGFGGTELYSAAKRISLISVLSQTDWLGLAHDQALCAVLLVCRAALPWMVRRTVPLLMRWRYAGIARALDDGRHGRTRTSFPVVGDGAVGNVIATRPDARRYAAALQRGRP
jgi:hypothetical protein